jgi:hypothetical protein
MMQILAGLRGGMTSGNPTPPRPIPRDPDPSHESGCPIFATVLSSLSRGPRQLAGGVVWWASGKARPEGANPPTPHKDQLLSPTLRPTDITP